MNTNPQPSPIPKFTCSKCGHVMDAVTGIDEKIPMEGDLNLCINCGHLTCFTSGLEGVRELTDQEWIDLTESSPNAWKQIRNAQSWIKERQANPDLNLLPCGCKIGNRVLDGEVVFVIEPCDLSCPHYVYAIEAAQEQGKEIKFKF